MNFILWYLSVGVSILFCQTIDLALAMNGNINIWFILKCTPAKILMWPAFMILEHKNREAAYGEIIQLVAGSQALRSALQTQEGIDAIKRAIKESK